ncbi:MAG: sialidase family protein [Rhodoglobus sp.]
MRVTPATLMIVAIAVSCALFSTSAATAAPPTWSPPVTLSAAGQDAQSPQVVSDGTTITAVWSRDDGTDYRVQASSSIDGGTTWSTPVNVSAAGEDGNEPQVVTGGGIITTTWRGQIGANHRVRTSSSSDGGATWSTPVTISDNNQEVLELQVITHGTALIASWYINDSQASARVRVSSSFDHGVTWSTPVVLSEAGFSARGHHVVTDGTTLTAIWYRYDGAKNRIQTTTSTNGGVTWSTPVNLSIVGEDAQDPQLVTDGNTLTATWYGKDGTFYRTRTSSSIDGGATWSTPVSLSPAGQTGSNQHVVTNGTTITITWYSYNGTYSAFQSSSSIDRGANWSATVEISDPTENAFDTHLFSDGTTITAIWRRHDGSNYRLRASLSADDGATWSTPVNIADAGVSAYGHRLFAADGTITIVWYVDNSINYRIQTSSYKGTKPTTNPTSGSTPAGVPLAASIPEPQLAATGVSANLGGGMIAGGLLLSGFVAVLLGARHRRAVTRD